MKLWAKPERDWFEWPLLALKPAVALAGPALLIYARTMYQYTYAATVNNLMKPIASPIGLGCAIVSVLLVGIGILELVRRRWKQAASDLVFALLALNSWMICGGLTVKLK